MSRDLHNPEMDQLCDAFLLLEDRDEVYRFLEDLCTVKELQAMSQRLEVAGLLQDEVTYQEIAERTGASTATISRVNRALTYGDEGYHMILERLEK